MTATGTTRKARVMLRAALPNEAGWPPARFLPRIPGWWPLAERGPDPDTGEARPNLTEPERTRLRHERAVREACMGPLDDDPRQRVATWLDGDDPPALYTVGSFTYRLAGWEGRRLVYRYAPALSPGHAAAMRAVEAAFADVGEAYAIQAAREGAIDDRHRKDR